MDASSHPLENKPHILQLKGLTEAPQRDELSIKDAKESDLESQGAITTRMFSLWHPMS